MKAIINWVKRNWPVSRSRFLDLEIQLIRVRGDLEASKEELRETLKDVSHLLREHVESSAKERTNLGDKILGIKHNIKKLEAICTGLHKSLEILTETCISYVVSEFTRENTPQIAEGESYNEWTVTDVSVNTENSTDIHFEYTLKFDESEVIVRDVSKQAIQTALNEKAKS